MKFYISQEGVVCMTIMRIHKSNNYTIVSNLLLDNTVLSEGATLLLLRMLRKPDDWQFSVQKLAEEYGMNKNKISRYFSELKEHKFLEITQVKASKNFAYTYHVYEIPYDCYLDDEGRIRNRDTKQEIVLNRYTTSLKTDRVSHTCAILGKYFSRNDGFLGTAQELIDNLPEEVRGEFTAKTLGKTLRSIEAALEKNYDFVVEYKKTKHARLISVHYTDEESPFAMAEMLGDITEPQNEGTILSPQNQRVTSPIPKTGIPETGIIINTELNKNKHKKVSDGSMRESDVTEVLNWASDFAFNLDWEEEAVDAVASFTADSCQSAYVFDLDAAVQDDMDSDVTDDDLIVHSLLDFESNECVLDLFDEEDLPDVPSSLESRMVVKQDGMGTSYPDTLCDTDLDLAMDDAFDDDCHISDYDLYSEDDFKDMEAFYEQSMAEWETHEENFNGSEEEDDDWFINRLPILRDTKHNPFLYLTDEDSEKTLKSNEQRSFFDQRGYTSTVKTALCKYVMDFQQNEDSIENDYDCEYGDMKRNTAIFKKQKKGFDKPSDKAYQKNACLTNKSPQKSISHLSSLLNMQAGYPTPGFEVLRE